jgi:type II secretory pathway component PulF
MAWETRRKRRYYYHKRRRNGRIISKYIGAGAEAVAYMAAVKERRVAAERAQQEQQALRMLDNEIAEFTRQVHALAAAALLTAGYHRHKREWRLQREAADD